MAHRQLMDSLTSHISLYHSQSPNPNPNPNPRTSILKWFSSLSLHQRLAHLTIVDSNFVQILLQMLAKLRAHGHGSFIILPDLPSRDSPFIPTLCFKKSRGLLARVADSDRAGRWLFESARLFESREGENVATCSCSPSRLDAVTLAEDLVEDVDRFVEAMDRISNGGFLRGEEAELGVDWVELNWLKSKGYYGIEAFLANRIEVSMRLAWLNSSSGRKRGVKLKEKLNAAGVAANVYWRKKGCVDWWGNLDAVTRKKIFTTIIMKAAKHLTCEVLKVASSASEGEIWLYSTGVDKLLQYNRPASAQRTIPTFPDDTEFGTVITPATFCKKPAALVRAFNSLFVLQDVIMMITSSLNNKHDIGKLFFSSLDSVCTISDCILRKMRGFIMVISLDCTKLELFEDELDKSSSGKSKEKLSVSNRKKKGRTRNTKRQNPIPKTCVDGASHDPLKNVKNDNSIGNDILASNSSLCSSLSGLTKENSSARKVEGENIEDVAESCNSSGPQCCILSNEKKELSSGLDILTCDADCEAITPPIPASKHGSLFSNEDTCPLKTTCAAKADVKSTVHDKPIREVNGKEYGMLKEQDRCLLESKNSAFSKCSPYEWPGIPSIYFPSFNSHLPPATDRLHLDVGRNWHNHFCYPFVPTLPQARNTPIEGGCNQILSHPIPMSFDWPPVFRGGMTPSPNCNYDSGFMSRRQCTFSKGLAVHSVQVDATSPDDERKYSGDILDLPDLTNGQELADEFDNHCVSEEEYDFHAVSDIDYNQYFGGGIMYWNPSDHPGKGFSRPPSLSSDDSLWALREADMNRTVDDMVAFPSSYNTNGLTSPTAATFCSPFDPVGAGSQTVGFVMSGNEVPGKVLHSSSATDAAVDEDNSGSLGNNLPGEIEGKAGDSHPYPILRPIIIPNLSRERSRCVDHKSPCVPPTRREQPRIKRPPSPVVLCVPRAPRPPPPSPVSDSRKQRGFPTVRSGSSSPRHWGMRGWYHDGSNLEEACLRMDGAEVVWPSWRSNNLAVQPLIQPLPAALLQDRLIAMSQIARDQEHPDVAFPLQPPELQSCSASSASLSLMHGMLHDEIDSFCNQVAAENMARRPYINWAVKRVTRSLQVLWPRSRTNIFGSNATGMSLPTSDVDLVVCLPPVRNLEPIKEAGILEGRNGIKETCLQHAARYLANQDWVKSDSLKTVENTAIPIIMLVVEVPQDVITPPAPMIHSLKEEPHCTPGEHGNDSHSDIIQLEDSGLLKSSQINSHALKESKSVRLDISFKTPSHTGLQTTEMVKELTEQFPAATPLALVLKQFLADRSLDQSYSGGLSSYCLVLLIIRFLQHEHHLGRPINQNYGSLLMDFLYFFGNVFDPRQMRISVQGSGFYIKRERGCSIDPIHIDDPLFPTNNVGRNCFRIHQCIKAFSEAYSVLEHELTFLNGDGEPCPRPSYRLLPKIIPSLDIS
ncbi:polymerase, nucleotidyl transferase domain [Sesbania bispinosa]|nr:polymerase, nucleotidyl transferase domain [Sesbania bispinosa]